MLIYSSPELKKATYVLWNKDGEKLCESGGGMFGPGMHGMPGMKPEGFEGMEPPEGFEGMEPPRGFEGKQPPEGMEPPQKPNDSMLHR